MQCSRDCQPFGGSGGIIRPTNKKLAATLLAAASITATPLLIAPSAQAEVCGEVGLYVRVGGCTNLAGDAVDAAVIGAAVDRPLAWGLLPPGYQALLHPGHRTLLPGLTDHAGGDDARIAVRGGALSRRGRVSVSRDPTGRRPAEGSGPSSGSLRGS